MDFGSARLTRPVRQPMRGLRGGFLVLMVVVVVGTAGYMFLADMDFHDAVYMVVITLSTVGFREVGTPESVEVRYWTILLIIFGISTVGYIAGFENDMSFSKRFCLNYGKQLFKHGVRQIFKKPNPS